MHKYPLPLITNGFSPQSPGSPTPTRVTCFDTLALEWYSWTLGKCDDVWTTHDYHVTASTALALVKATDLRTKWWAN